jgi:predicted Zn-dependent protease
MTRDGTFWVENGKIQCGVKNLRFNQSVIIMLGKVELMGLPQRTAGEISFEMAALAMKVRDFSFSCLTKF